MDIVQLLNDLPDWLLAISAVIAAANGITMLTPTKVDDKALGIAGKVINIALKILNVLSINVIKNKNADDK